LKYRIQWVVDQARNPTARKKGERNKGERNKERMGCR
jgi:hypothetical protein